MPNPVARILAPVRSVIPYRLWRYIGLRDSPLGSFQGFHYTRHNQRRQEHLATLGLGLDHRTVLEIGAGIGDHTTFFLDRQCQVTVTEGRPANLNVLKHRYPDLDVRLLDMEHPSDEGLASGYDLIYCYGLLYHIRTPAEAIDFMARHCKQMLLLETCVSMGENEAVNLCDEVADEVTQSVSGTGCRPTRPWIFNRLRSHFPHVYLPVTQPWHAEFPLDWTKPHTAAPLTRAVFIASRQPLDNPLLTEAVPMLQRRC